MCEGRVSDKKTAEAWVEGTSKRTVLTGPWMLAHGADTLRVVLERRAAEGTFNEEVYYRYAATRTDRPDGWAQFSTPLTQDTNGRSIADEDLSGTSNKMWVQTAVRASSASGATGEALAGLQAATKAQGRIIAARTLQIQPVLNSGEAMYIPLSDLHPALGLSSYMFAVLLEGVSGTGSYQAAYRTFETGRDDAASTWTDLGSSTSVMDWNSTVLTVTPGTKLFAQPGLKITSTGGRAKARVIVSKV